MPAAWELVWNDPLDDEDFQREIRERSEAAETPYPDLYINNHKRRTAYYFSEKGVDHFLKANGLSHVVRAHEDQDAGFAFHHSGKTITIFSTSNYSGRSNRCAVLLISEGKIRPLQILD